MFLEKKAENPDPKRSRFAYSLLSTHWGGGGGITSSEGPEAFPEPEIAYYGAPQRENERTHVYLYTNQFGDMMKLVLIRFCPPKKIA